MKANKVSVIDENEMLAKILLGLLFWPKKNCRIIYMPVYKNAKYSLAILSQPESVRKEKIIKSIMKAKETANCQP